MNESMVLTFIGVNQVSRVTRDISRDMDLMGGKAAGLGAAISGGLRNASDTFLGMARNVGMLAGGFGMAFTSMFKNASDLDYALLQLQTHAGFTGNIDEMRQAILGVSTDTGIAAQNLAQADYYISSQGGRFASSVQDNIEVLQAAARTSAMTGSDINETAKVLGLMLHDFPDEFHSAADAAGYMNAVVSSGIMTMQQFTGSLRTGLLGQARYAGQDFREIGAMMDVISRSSGGVNQAAVGIRNFFVMLGASGVGERAKAFQNIGLDAKALYNQAVKSPDGAVAALLEVEKHLKTLDAASRQEFLSKAFGGTRTSGVVGMLVQGLNSGELQQIMATNDQMATDFAGLWTQAMNNPKIAVDRLHTSFDALGITIAQVVMPVVVPLINTINSGLTAIRNWVTAHQALIAQMLPLGARILAVTLAFSATMGIGLRLVSLVFSPLRLALMAVAVAFGIVEGSGGNLGATLTRVGEAVGAKMGEALKFVQNLATRLRPAADTVGRALTVMWDGLQKVANFIRTDLLTRLTSLHTTGSSALAAIGTAWSAMVANLHGEEWRHLFDQINSGLSSASSGSASLAANIGKLIGQLLSYGVPRFLEASTTSFEIMGAILPHVVDLLNSVFGILDAHKTIANIVFGVITLGILERETRKALGPVGMLMGLFTSGAAVTALSTIVSLLRVMAGLTVGTLGFGLEKAGFGFGGSMRSTGYGVAGAGVGRGSGQMGDRFRRITLGDAYVDKLKQVQAAEARTAAQIQAAEARKNAWLEREETRHSNRMAQIQSAMNARLEIISEQLAARLEELAGMADARIRVKTTPGVRPVNAPAGTGGPRQSTGVQKVTMPLTPVVNAINACCEATTGWLSRIYEAIIVSGDISGSTAGRMLANKRWSKRANAPATAAEEAAAGEALAADAAAVTPTRRANRVQRGGKQGGRMSLGGAAGAGMGAVAAVGIADSMGLIPGTTDAQGNSTGLGNAINIASTASMIVMAVQMVAGILPEWATITAIFTGAAEAIGGAFAIIAGVISAPVLIIGAAVAAIGVGAYLLITHWQQVSDAMAEARRRIGDAIGGIVGWFGNLLSGASSHLNAVVNTVHSWFTNVVGWFTAIPGRIAGVARGVWNAVANIGRNIISGMAAGISNALGALGGKIRDAVSFVIDHFNALFGNHSPSRVMAERVGIPLAQGIGMGLTMGLPHITGAMAGLQPAIVASASRLGVAAYAGGGAAAGGDDTGQQIVDLLTTLVGMQQQDAEAGVQAKLYNAISDTITARRRGIRTGA